MELLRAGVSHPVPPGGGSLGSGEGVWLRLQGAGVLPEHARVRVESAGLAIAPATPEALLLVNGAAVGPDPHFLSDGDRIGIGTETLAVKIRAVPRSAPPPGAAQQLADTLAGVPSFHPKSPIQGSIRQPDAPPPRTGEGLPSGGGRALRWAVLAVVLLGVVLYLAMSR